MVYRIVLSSESVRTTLYLRLITADIQVKIIAIDINSYPNKFRFNMNEYNGINIGLLNAKEKFVVVNSIDIIYDETFFTFIKSIKAKTVF